MMGRQTRRFITRVFTFGIVACCFFTFFPRIKFSSPELLSGVDVSHRDGQREKVGFTKVLTFAQAALEMKAFFRNLNNNGSGSAASGHRGHLTNASKYGNSQFITSATDIDELPKSCSDTTERSNYLNNKASIIISLTHLGYDDPVFLLSRLLRHIPNHVTEDVIITARKFLSEKVKERIENAVDICAHCRLFFLEGTIYEHWNSASKFSREDILIFVDGRIIPDDGWIEPLLFELNFNHQAVVSPHLHLWNAEKAISDVSLSRLEMTWDLNVFRSPLTKIQKSLVQNGQVTAVNQTSVLKEVIAIRKDFFELLGFFDIIPGASGGEHVSFSLKTINCGGEIFMAICSRVFLETLSSYPSSTSSGLESDKMFFMRDYHSPSFREPKFNVTVYYDANSKIWLDSYSSNFYSTSLHRQADYSAVSKRRKSSSYKTSFLYAKYGRHANALKSKMMSMECEITNFRYIITKFQTNMLSPVKRTTHFGYIRSRDSMYAIGLHPDSPFFFSSSSSNSHVIISNRDTVIRMKHSDGKHNNQMDNNSLVFTRNSSLWLGPISYIEGKLKYRRMWCVTAGPKLLTLQLCQKENSDQVFLFNNGVFRLASGGGRSCVIFEQPKTHSSTITVEAVTKNLLMSSCDIKKLKDNPYYMIMDMEFLE